ncbi:response regulator [Desulfococcaceae bacterium HSG8]|nr:response regulator [Desulfococcaceae bacterium HSG8]
MMKTNFRKETMMTDVNNATILIIEDDPGHSRLIEKNLRRANVKNGIIKVTDGRQALDYLFEEGEYAGQKRASSLLVLLDLNLPVFSGIQVLRRMRENDSAKLIPVIILTTSDDNHDISRCYELGCNVYVTKPVDYGKFSEAVQKLGLLLSVASVPERS